MADERPGNSNSEKPSPLERYLAKQKQSKSEEPPKPKRVVPQPAKNPAPSPDESSAYGVPAAPAFPRPAGEATKFGLGSRRTTQAGNETPASVSTPAPAPTPTPYRGEGNETHVDEIAGSPAQNLAFAGAPAGFFIRLVAYFIDMLIIAAITVPVRAILGLVFNLMTLGNGDLVAGPVAFIAFYGTIFFYFGYFYSEKGASPGKLLFKMQIHDADAPFARLSYGKAFFRESIGKIAAAAPLFIGFLVSLFRADRRALHDLLFDTQVTRTTAPPVVLP